MDFFFHKWKNICMVLQWKYFFNKQDLNITKVIFIQVYIIYWWCSCLDLGEKDSKKQYWMKSSICTWFIIDFLPLSWERCNFASWSLPCPQWTNNKNDQANGNGHSFVKLPRPAPKIYIPSTKLILHLCVSVQIGQTLFQLPIFAPS